MSVFDRPPSECYRRCPSYKAGYRFNACGGCPDGAVDGCWVKGPEKGYIVCPFFKDGYEFKGCPSSWCHPKAIDGCYIPKPTEE